ncbi:hypothetical protein N7532_005045 [Penicillium argentinense]|uniref:ADF-H domain-containing protein n=1 Tax=Penicillium argentinense TaxID=1131581 RepID=A0A9W9FDF2_9EURO|nr:uncharacterized protein N7532_005045 [Penicillium argentinense]KAJ5098044.1 hypothetical protein N7532_005045 [Penicillium argentinense]
MQSGISVSPELQDAFTSFSGNSSSFCLPVTITGESLTPLSPLSFSGSPSSPESFFSSLSQISSILQPKTPIYLLLRRPTSAASNLIALTYIPSNAPVRPKMLFASTRSTLTRELGTEKFASTVFATEEEEIVSPDAWRERDGENSPARREELMGEKERELEAVRRAEAEARSGTLQRDIGIGGTFGPGSGSGMRVSMPVDDAAKSALKELQDGGLVQLTIDISTEKIILADSQSGVDAGAVATHISSTSPGTPSTTTLARMSLSSCTPAPLDLRLRSACCTLARVGTLLRLPKKRIEASGPDEITGDRLQEEVHPSQNTGIARGFARPRRPGR